MLSITALAAVAETPPSLEGTTGTNFEVVPEAKIGTRLYANNDEYGDNTVTAQTPFFWYASTNLTEEIAQADPSISFADTTSEFGTYTNFFGEYIGNRPDIASQAQTTNRCLLIDTEGGRLFRRICGATDSGKGLNAFQQYSVTNAVYFDSLVQFTVNEDESPTIQTGDKLAVWLQGGETTNLVITAGYLGVIDGSDDFVISTNYVVDAGKDIVPGVWYRLTIEAIPLIPNASSGNGYLGFRVRIDEQEVSTTQGKFTADEMANTFGAFVGVYIAGADASAGTDFSGEALQKLFPSLVQGITHCDTLSCVAFEGTGAVDDLTFTDTDPFGVTPSGNPVVDGTTLDPAQVFFTNGVAAARTDRAITYPTAPVLSGDVGSQKITFGGVEVEVPEYYTATLNGNVVSLALNNTALPTIGAANVTVGEETEAKEAIEVGDTTFTATLTSTSTKLYYGLKVAASPNAAEWTVGELTQGTGSAMQLTADKPVDGSTVAPAAFFKVYVTDIAPAAPASAGE